MYLPLFPQVIKDSDLLIVDSDVKLDKKNKDNAPLLVEKLIKNKTGEKEKFDVIFSWVAQNISYNKYSFYVATNTGPKEIARILTSRNTICLGYAQLMDTLCKLAGIPNVTVFGYAKDQFYDVNDSIFGHNHAWNAVKLDGLWYLYDVTWSGGVTEYKLTKKANLIDRLLKKIPEKFKKKGIRIPKRFRRKSFCEDKIESIYYYKKRFFNSLIRNWLMSRPIKAHETYKHGIIKNFYLSTPEIFAATHVPDDPMWSLINRNKCDEFEKDSLFYYLSDSIYQTQVRQGKACIACDQFYNQKLQGRLEILAHNSHSFNPNNHFISTLCDEELGRMLFFKSLPKNNESAIKADSVVTFFQNAYNNILVSRQNLKKYFKNEKNKNDKKTQLLLIDNKTHFNFIKSKVKITIHNTQLFHEISNKTKAFGLNYYNTIHRMRKLKTDFNFDKLKPFSDKKIIELETLNRKKTHQLDSLILTIISQKNSFDSIITNLSLNIWPQIFMHDSILIPFKKCTYHRRFLIDNYKKIIVDLRKKIRPMEVKYANQINYILYNPLKECDSLFKIITKNIKLKHSLFNNLHKLNIELLKSKVYTVSNVKAFKETSIKETEFDFCWLRSNSPKIINTLNGLYVLGDKQNYALKIISFENEIERKRKAIINKAIKNGYKASNNLIATDTKQIKKKLKLSSKYLSEIKDTINFNPKRYDKIIEQFKIMLEKK